MCEMCVGWSRCRVSKPGQAPPPPGGPAAWPVGTAISHAIPQQLVQTLNLHRWNCNVFGWSRKMTVGNYVRNLCGVGGVWVFRTVCFERVVLSSPGCLWPGRMDDHEEVLEAHA